MTQSAFELRRDQPGPQSGIADSGGGRLVDRLDHRLVNVLTVLGFGLPAIGYLWFLSRFSVNAIVGDQWDDVPVIQQSYVHFFDWGSMWAQHNENRIFFPNIIVVVLAHTAHFNIRVEEYLGAADAICGDDVHSLGAQAAVTVNTVALLLPRRIPRFLGRPVREYDLGLSDGLVHGASFHGNGYSAPRSNHPDLGDVCGRPRGRGGGQFFLPSRAAHLADRSRAPVLPAPVLAATERLDRRSDRFGDPLLSPLQFSATPYPQFARQHPLIALKFFLFAVGDVVGKPVPLGSAHTNNTLVVLLGLGIVILAVAAVFICGFRRDEHGSSPVGIALICFGLLFAAVITQGRSFLGYGGASFSRYTTFDLLILVGTYLALLGRRLHVPRGGKLETSSLTPPPSTSNWRHVRVAGGWMQRIALPSTLALVLVAIVIQIPFGAYNGVQGARHNYADDVKAASVLRNIDHASNAEISRYLFFLESPSGVRYQARILELHRLSVFANG